MKTSTKNNRVKTVVGDVFIIPNRLDNNMVQVWATSGLDNSDKEHYSENWRDHGHPDFGTRFPYALPMGVFEGKTEGDVVVLEHDGKRVELTLNQRDYRYSRFGNFEDVFSKVTSHFSNAA